VSRSRRPPPAQPARRIRSYRVELEAHAAEEAEHVALWDGFLTEVGGKVGAQPRAETVACVRAWTGEG